MKKRTKKELKQQSISAVKLNNNTISVLKQKYKQNTKNNKQINNKQEKTDPKQIDYVINLVLISISFC